MKQFALGLVTAIAIGASLAQAQWLKDPTPGIPRLPDGKANLNAPAPRKGVGSHFPVTLPPRPRRNGRVLEK